MKGDASSASTFAEIVENTYGWNVMKPKAIDKEMWDEIYDVYVKDKFNLGVDKYFEEKNPAALQQITAVMMETARKGMWKASDEQLAEIAKMHTELVKKYQPACTGFVCDNSKLRQYIADKVDPTTAKQYKQEISEVREAVAKGDKGMVMKKEQMNDTADKESSRVSNVIVIAIVAVVAIILGVVIRKRRKSLKD